MAKHEPVAGVKGQSGGRAAGLSLGSTGFEILLAEGDSSAVCLCFLCPPPNDSHIGGLL